jgi:hypothetical protein
VPSLLGRGGRRAGFLQVKARLVGYLPLRVGGPFLRHELHQLLAPGRFQVWGNGSLLVSPRPSDENSLAISGELRNRLLRKEPITAQSLTQIMTDWNRYNKNYGPRIDKPAKGSKPEKDPQKEKVTTEQTRVTRGFKFLKNRLKAAAKDSKRAPAFEDVKKNVLIVMGVYYKKTLTPTMKFLKKPQQYRTSVLELIAAVRELNLTHVAPQDLVDDPREGVVIEEEEEEGQDEQGDEGQEVDEALERQILAGLDLPENADHISFEEEAETEEEEELLQKSQPTTQPQAKVSKVSVLKRLNELMGDYQKALSMKGADVARIQEQFHSLKGLIDNEAFQDADQVINKLEGMVHLTLAGSGPQAKENPLAALARVQLQWQSGLAEVRKQIQSLQKAILTENKDFDGAAGAKKVATVLDNFKEGLELVMVSIVKAPTPQERVPYLAQAMTLVEKYTKYVDTNKLVAHIEVNPYTGVTIKELLLPPLRTLNTQLQNL